MSIIVELDLRFAARNMIQQIELNNLEATKIATKAIEDAVKELDEDTVYELLKSQVKKQIKDAMIDAVNQAINKWSLHDVISKAIKTSVEKKALIIGNKLSKELLN